MFIKLLKFSIITITAFLFLFFLENIDNNVLAQGEGDAISVRILPNPNHRSPLSWYIDQGFKGKPKALKVDGYEAIQEGRTVYVNVANIVGDKLYTNIYLISYNQKADVETLSIFSKILDRWKFNINLTDEAIEAGSCFYQDNVDQVCYTDRECTGGGFCDSKKAKITRDVKRLADVIDIKEKVELYEREYKHYPRIEAGTYIKGKTISTWPSWKDEFSRAINMKNIPVDPINKMGDCGGPQYDERTCWDQANKSFPTTIPELPGDSRAIVYSVDPNSLSYTTCAVMESGYIAGSEVFDNAGCAGSTTDNTAPEIKCGTLVGSDGEEFKGYVEISDAEGDEIISVSVTGLPAGFEMRETPNNNQKEIYSEEATIVAEDENEDDDGEDDDEFTIEATDYKGAIATTVCSISLEDEYFIIYPVLEQNIIVGEKVGVSIFAYYSKKNYTGITFSFSDDLGGATCDFEEVRPNKQYKCEINFDAEYVGTIFSSVTAKIGDKTSNSQNIIINVSNKAPIFDTISCPSEVRANDDDDIYLCNFTARDPENHDFNFFVTGLPSGLSYVEDGPGRGKIIGKPLESGNFSISLKAIDEYGADSKVHGGQDVTVELQVNSYCGDGIKQPKSPADVAPNSEGTGGPNNDGFEDCDGEDGIAITASDSGPSKQYGCSSSCIATGGYCGDGEINPDYNEASIIGNVKDALTNTNLEDVSVKIENGTEYTTDYQGNFNINEACDNIEITLSKPGYIVLKDVVSLSGGDTELNYYMFPNTWDGNFAIVLTWDGQEDLDTYLKIDTQMLSYSYGCSGACAGVGGCGIMVNGSRIDLDDCSTYGHETVTIKNTRVNKEYLYRVSSVYGDDFNNKVNVRIFQKDGSTMKMVGSYNATNHGEMHWTVFSFKPVNSNDAGEITKINSYN